MSIKDINVALYDSLVDELVGLFEQRGFTIEGARLEPKYRPPDPIRNGRFGDQEDRVPDVLAFDYDGRRGIIGMVCLSDDDITSDETLTKFNVFLNLPVPQKEKPGLLFVIVPSSKIVHITDFITHSLHPEYWEAIQIVASQKIQ